MPDWFTNDGETHFEREARVVFGAWLYAARQNMGCSQAAFGGMVGLHQSTISRLEHGQIRHLLFATAIRLLVVILEALVVPRPGPPTPVPRLPRAW